MWHRKPIVCSDQVHSRYSIFTVTLFSILLIDDIDSEIDTQTITFSREHLPLTRHDFCIYDLNIGLDIRSHGKFLMVNDILTMVENFIPFVVRPTTANAAVTHFFPISLCTGPSQTSNTQKLR